MRSMDTFTPPIHGIWLTILVWVTGILAVGLIIWFIIYTESNKYSAKTKHIIFFDIKLPGEMKTWWITIVSILVISFITGVFIQLLLVVLDMGLL